ncbi:DUF2293 domain-containing protein [Sinorhizobium sp. 7-81]|uniref:DUF2293 domain-containing protein n=1 Tax=Sinorhizobium sp. 8-89 TaxID=3049089 RepID=UPI0024C2BD4E|nr:DUF2293 domain-containing protein [Sinorhizobium sp. 8-89]MDK1488643.1 DUF2293 domain-containing protein [Sinorhizobium sp. 8-89]
MARYSVGAVERHLRRKHPGCPDFAIAYFVNVIAGKDWLDASLGKAVGITMQTFLRHEMTEYDTLLLHGMDREEARRRVQPRINAMLQVWKKKPRAAKRTRNGQAADV